MKETSGYYKWGLLHTHFKNSQIWSAMPKDLPLAYETLSETDASIGHRDSFDPNVFVDISDWLEEKIRVLKCYESELGEFPFPRSEEAVRALSKVRGAASGFMAAEAFMLLKERF